VATTAVVAPQLFVRRDRSALEYDVVSSSDPCPWQEGREEPAMDQMSTIMVKPERKEQQLLPGMPNIEVVYDTPPQDYYKSSPWWFIIRGTMALYT
jgi:hypothetical protein